MNESRRQIGQKTSPKQKIDITAKATICSDTGDNMSTATMFDKSEENADKKSSQQSSKTVNTQEEKTAKVVAEKKILDCLKSLFDTWNAKIVIQKMIRATKKLHSPELEVIMGEEYPDFQNLNRKEKIRHLCARLMKFHRMELKLIKEEEKQRKESEEKMKKEEEEAKLELKLQNEFESIIKSLLDDILLTDQGEKYDLPVDDTNYSAISVRQSVADQTKFNEILSFWKNIDSSHIKIQLLEAMRESGKISSTEDSAACSSNLLPPDLVAGGDPVGLRQFPTKPKTVLRKLFDALFLTSLTLKLIIVVSVGLCFLVFEGWKWWNQEDINLECGYPCENLTVFLFYKALEFLI